MLGWAGVEIRTAAGSLVIDPLKDATAVFAAFGHPEEPLLAEVSNPGGCALALLTHLHRDHADAGALLDALAPGATVLAPAGATDDRPEDIGMHQAQHELAAAGVELREVGTWQTLTLGGFSLSTVPAVDSLGEPQVSWIVEGDGSRVVHLGDTMFHGWWWRAPCATGPLISRWCRSMEPC